jgi:hypothetical protein
MDSLGKIGGQYPQNPHPAHLPIPHFIIYIRLADSSEQWLF